MLRLSGGLMLSQSVVSFDVRTPCWLACCILLVSSFKLLRLQWCSYPSSVCLKGHFSLAVSCSSNLFSD